MERKGDEREWEKRRGGDEREGEKRRGRGVRGKERRGEEGGREGRREEERKGGEREGERSMANSERRKGMYLCMFFSVQSFFVCFTCTYDMHLYTSYIYSLVPVPDLSHEVLEIVDCCNVVVVHFYVHIWVDPTGREERWREERWRKERWRERRREERWREESGGRRGGGRGGEGGGEGKRRMKWREWRDGRGPME